ncbi:hypothetical protein NSS66_21045 [Paenibacillus sp. FSL R10-2748]|uniref:hypothetical protein n=1 Tax=Paenibacillus peoriae TaxID=59893 RepID=UPI0015C3ACD8|nr:hypothetical protein [Paenibacillus peoriae]
MAVMLMPVAPAPLAGPTGPTALAEPTRSGGLQSGVPVAPASPLFHYHLLH